MNEATFGPRLTKNGAQFRLWAPAANQVDVMLNGTSHAMTGQDQGWFATEVAGVTAGARYIFRIDGTLEVPDPAAAFQPEGMSGPSQVIDHTAYCWQADPWRGRPWTETVLIETHVGTFTSQGTYRAMADKLDHLVATGITAIELMPVAEFAGRRGWGYDGVLWYAPTHNYGRPDDLKALIDAAHGRGLMVFLDVVYNHFGPEGNYLGQYAPEFFSSAQTPWGNAIDYGVPLVRVFAIENALHWLRDYRFDGLRLDAVHTIVDAGEPTLLRELSIAVGKLAAETGRHIHLVLENDDNIATVLDPDADPAQGQYRAQWNDDYHHAWHALLAGESHGYYSDYVDAPRQHLATALRSGFAYQGEASPHRNGQPRGQSSGMLPPIAFVNFLQNHDQIGNRALGERLESLAAPKAIEAALAITLLAPAIPMLFMGEEWGATTPFPYFCDFVGDLASAVRRGRRQEFAGAYEIHGDEVPDPLDEETFRSAMLDWSSGGGGTGAQRLALVQDLLTLRRREIVPRLTGAQFAKVNSTNNGVLRANWRLGDGALLRLTANLSEQVIVHRPHAVPSTLLWGDDDTTSLAPWSVLWQMETP